jgi:hypothetical protein
LSSAAIHKFSLYKSKSAPTRLHGAIHLNLVRSVAIGTAETIAITVKNAKYQTTSRRHTKGIAIGQTSGQGITCLILKQPAGFARVVVWYDCYDYLGLCGSATLSKAAAKTAKQQR